MSEASPVRRLNDFASVRAITVASLAPLAQPELDFRSAPGRWSLGEIADHLLLAEQLYRGEIERLVAKARAGEVPYVKYTFADIDVRPLGLPVSVLSFVEAPFGAISRNLPDPLRNFLTLNPLIPARNPSMAAPRPNRPAADLLHELRGAMARTRALIEDNSDLDMSAMKVDHPVTGVTNVSDILLFLARHERRHQRQMEAVRADRRFPLARGAA